MRYKFSYWFTLFWGVVLATFQVYKYFTDNLSDNIIELFVFGFALLLILKPSFLVNLFEKYGNDKISK